MNSTATTRARTYVKVAEHPPFGKKWVKVSGAVTENGNRTEITKCPEVRITGKGISIRSANKDKKGKRKPLTRDERMLATYALMQHLRNQ